MVLALRKGVDRCLKYLLIVDASVIIAALLRDSTTRKVLLNSDLRLVAPGMVEDEISRHIEELSARNSLPVETNRRALGMLLRHIRLLDLDDYGGFLPDALRLIGERDASDAPYLAAALAVKADGIWSHDADFTVQDRFRVWTTAQLRELLFGGKVEPSTLPP